MPGEPEDDRVTVTVAARKLGAKERTLFRAVAEGQIPSAKRGGVTVVSIADVERWEARRASRRGPVLTPAPAAAPVPQPAIPTAPSAAAVMSAGRQNGSAGGSAPTSLVLDGDLASVLFAAYDRGETPTELVQRHHVAPAVALLAMRQYEELRELSGGQDRFESTVAQLRAENAQLRQDLELLVTAQDELASRVQAVASRVNTIPVANSSVSACQACGARWLHGRPAPCPECGEKAVVGTFSPAPRA